MLLVAFGIVVCVIGAVLLLKERAAADETLQGLRAVLEELVMHLEKAAPSAHSAPETADDDIAASRDDAVLELARAGFTEAEIARKLGRPQGEIALIMSLRKLAP